MVSVQFDEASASPESADPIHEIRPWREAGWIFTDGGAVTIERQGERTRVRQARISHLREE
jgi:hypothetical protein